MSLLFNQATKQMQQLRKDLNEFSESPSTTPISLIGAITTTMTNLQRILTDFEDYISKQTLDADSQKKNQNRLEGLRNELNDHRLQFSLFKKQREESVKEQDRTHLFDSVSTSTAISDNPYSIGIRASKQKNIMDNEGAADYRNGMLDETNRLDRSNAQLDEILEMGRQAFDDLVEQNEIINNVRDKMSQGLSTLGVSKETVGLIERKAWEDKWIFYIGAILTLYIMYLIWYYLT